MAEHAAGHETIENGRCFWEPSNKTHPPLFQNGDLVFQAHHVGWIVSGFFTVIAVVVSIWLIERHLRYYHNKPQQRQIVRLLLMVPIYAVVSFVSYIYWNHAVSIVLARDCYESFVLYSFFYLLLLYISNDPMEQRQIFQNVTIDKWMWPLGFIKWRPEDGLYFLQLMKWGVLQYCVLRPVCTLAAVILNYIGLYCEESWSPGYGHIWVLVIISLSVTVAMYCLLQLYFAVADELKPHKPLLKLFAVKAVVFLTFWQASALAVFAMAGVVKDTEYMSAADINIGIGAILETFEMMLFAFLHVKAFSYRPYQPEDKKKTLRWRAFRHAFWYRDMWKEFKEGTVYLWRRMRGKEAEKVMRKQMHLENAMGRSRRIHRGAGGGVRPEPKEGLPGERPELPWLEVDSPGAELGSEVDKELEKRGLRSRPREDQELLDARAIGHSKQTSWWRRAMHRVSGRASGDDRYAELGSPKEKLQSSRYGDIDMNMDPLDDPPPPSIIGRGHGHQGRSPRGAKYAPVTASDDEDKLELGARQRREQGRRKRNKEHERDGGKPPYIPQRSQPLDFRPTDHHKQAQQAERALAPSTPEYALRSAELSRSPPRAAGPLKTPSIARTDSLLGRMFTRPADGTALSHSGEGNSTPALSRNMSMASDPRLLSFKDTHPPNFAALTLQSPILSQAPDAPPTNDGHARPPSAAPRSHAKEETVPPPAPPKDMPRRSTSPAGSVASFQTAADSEVFSLLLRPADEPPAPPKKRQSKDQLPPLPDAQPLSPIQTQSQSEIAAHAIISPVLGHPLARPQAEILPSTQQATRSVAPPQAYDSGPPRNLRRPAKIVIPAPLSPARYPDGRDAIPGASHRGVPPAMDPRRDDFAVPPTSSREHRRRPNPQQTVSPPRQEQQRHRDSAPRPMEQHAQMQQHGQQYGQVPRSDQQHGQAQWFSQQHGQAQRFDRPYGAPRNEHHAGYPQVSHSTGPYPYQERGRVPLSPPSTSRYNQHNASPHERGRRTERRSGPPPLGSGSPHHYLPPPVLPGLEYPPSPPRVPQSPPHAAMFPGSNYASPERSGFAASPTEMSPSRILRLPRDDVPVTRPPLVSGQSTLSIATSRDGPGPRHPHVQQYARKSVDSVGLSYPAEVVHTNAQSSRQDRRRSAPVAPQAHPPPGQRYNFSPTRQPEARHAHHGRPPGAAAPRVHSPRGDRGGDYNRFPAPLSPTPLRPSPTNITNITPRTPDPTTGLVPYTLRQDRPPSGMETVRAPWT